MNIFDKIRGALSGKAAPTSAALFDLLTGARAELADAEHRLADAEAGRADAVLGGDAARTAARASLAAARDDRDDAAAAVAALEVRHAEALTAEEEADRRACYDAALALRDAAARRLRKDYPRISRDLVDLIRTVYTADAAVETVNGALPKGAEPLISSESLVRDIPGRPARVVSEEIIEEWTREGLDRPAVDVELRGLEIDEKTGDGIIRTEVPYQHDDRTGKPVMYVTIHHYKRRRFLKTVTLPAGNTRWGERFYNLTLPGLRSIDPPYIRAFGYNASPGFVVSTLDELAAEKPLTLDDLHPDPVVKYELLPDEPTPAAEAAE